MCKFTEWVRCYCCCTCFWLMLLLVQFTSWSHKRCCCAVRSSVQFQSFGSAINPIKNWPSTKHNIPFLVFHLLCSEVLFWVLAELNEMKHHSTRYHHSSFLSHRLMAINSNLLTSRTRSHRIASQLLLIIVVLSICFHCSASIWLW